jgi:hypothetical protein
MATRTVPKAEWPALFKGLAKALAGDRAEVEVASLNLGTQVAVEWMPLVGITYDSKDDLLDVALERTDHLIRHPRQIAVDETAGAISSVAVVDAEGARQVVKLKKPAQLPS